MPQANDIVIVSAARTPVGRFEGGLSGVTAPELGAVVIRQAIARAGVPPDMVDEVLMGNVLQAGLGQAPARQASIAAGLPVSVGASTINKVCGSGLKTVMLGAAMLKAGDAQLVVAGGMESMNGAPYLLPKARFGYRMGAGEIVDGMVHDGLRCALSDQSMGDAAEWIAREYGITREAMDGYALQSHKRAAAARDSDAFAREIVPVTVPRRKERPSCLDADECIRPDTNLEKLARLAPAFQQAGRVTAGNASAIADGAAAVTLMRRSRASALGCRPLARLVCYGQTATEPAKIFTAPVGAVQRVLHAAGMALSDLHLIELNEAFAAQVLANARVLGLDDERLNVNGGAIALGHPIGASGTRILVTLLYALAERGLERGLAAACLGGGEAVALIVEMEQPA